MSQILRAILAVVLLAPAGARTADAGLRLYLQPLPADAARLAFKLTSVSAVTANGAEFPLALNLRTVERPESARQRLLASGAIPSGNYAGFVVRVGQASLRREHGEAALSVPDAPVRVDYPFTVASHRSSVFWMALDHARSMTGSFGFNPVFSIAVPPRPLAGNAGFVTDVDSNTITIFDKQLAEVVGVFDTCGGPGGLALDQRRRRLYVACSADDEILSIDAATGDILERGRVSPGDRPRELALTPDGATLLSANPASNSVSVFEAQSLARGERIAVGSGPASLAIDPSGRRAFVFNTLSDSVSVIDIAARRVVATLTTDSAPTLGRFNRAGDRLYVIHERSPYMEAIDPTSLTVATKVRMGAAAAAVEVDSVRSLVCVAGGDAAVEFYDPTALMPLFALRARADAAYLRIDAEEGELYLLCPGTRSLLVARLADRRVVAEIDVGGRPFRVAVMGER